MRRYWTNEERNYLRENVGQLKISTMADKLGRTEDSVLQMLKKLGLSNTKASTGLLTTYQLSQLLQVDAKTVRHWILNHGLKCTKKTTRNIKKWYLIDPDDFWDWAAENRERITFSKIKYQSIPPEPAWCRTERMKERKNGSKNNYKNWSTLEERLVIQLISSGESYAAVGERLDRSSVSVERKYKRLIENTYSIAQHS
ncbi:helix-turn-helix domain-containing protein [Bacillus sp. V59.32b]|uniref:helix-turn-helix domain-containing protein n=1 Tax=Bacillus sp. V59.32b TaxID=1758642 RepID=UPI000E3CC12E|nr:helix-turn-helix domain-containing protein [Bacillus sp. V59.32b]RFU66822.1 DNA-binding protein [Bacillus sp. V59.32b]